MEPIMSRDFAAFLASQPKGRFDGIRRPYGAADVARLAGSVTIAQTLAERGAARLWRQLAEKPYVHALGAVTGNQAMQMVRAGLEAIYLSGWQVAADANTAGAMYPDQSLYPANAGPELCRRINRTLQRADQIERSEGAPSRDWLVPIVADAEAGFGGPLNAFEIMKAYIEAGAAAVHFEDQLASEKKCGHLGGKVLIPTAQHERNLIAARLAADVMGVATLIVARTDAEIGAADHLRHRPARPAVHRGGRAHGGGLPSPEGGHRARPLHRARPRLRALCRSPVVGDLASRSRRRPRLRRGHPCRSIRASCSPITARPRSTGRQKLEPETIETFQRELGAMGYRFQFVTLAGFHALNHSMFQLASGYRGSRHGAPIANCRQAEFAAEAEGYTATRHQREVGTGYFDAVALAITGGRSSTTAMAASTEAEQFLTAAE